MSLFSDDGFLHRGKINLMIFTTMNHVCLMEISLAALVLEQLNY